MSEKFNTNTQLTPEKLAKHLRQPDGDTGKQVGLMMNKGNKHICLNTYDVLKPIDNEHTLEIGMGNGFFIKDLLQKATNLSYTGVDFSPTMIKEAEELNQSFIQSGKVNFKEASIENLPFKDNTFNAITTTNTLYFWPNPLENAQGLLNVLKADGRLVIGYREKELMDQLELSKYGFTKYTVKETELLLQNAGFKNIETIEIQEPELDFDGKALKMSGFYTTAVK